MALKNDDAFQNIRVAEGAAVKALSSYFELTLLINSTFYGSGSCSVYSCQVPLSLWRQ